ncbi:MAG: hypothetical protein AB2556_10050 [Candidatus Thiodiazotropha sp.]|nr:MAG: hypothetical protein DBO99_19780 [gamma proteobacterium symbiont of Ctena orbiculata]PUB73961.1 MAG: hypothetical protein DBP03_11325 [gamma proteobacterium symbiont of Ctena orbiculata]
MFVIPAHAGIQASWDMSQVPKLLKVDKRVRQTGQNEGWWFELLDSGMRRNDVHLDFPSTE